MSFELVSGILGTLALGIIGSAVYTVLIQDHMEQWRETLRKSRKGWSRRRYVEIFISAVQEESITTPGLLLHLILANLLLLIGFAVSNMLAPLEAPSPGLGGIVLVVGTLGAIYHQLCRSPQYFFRARFEAELRRFMTRIQGLASKAELAQLTVLEFQVKDEASAKEFVDHITTIAERHDIGPVVKNFRLWDQA